MNDKGMHLCPSKCLLVEKVPVVCACWCAVNITLLLSDENLYKVNSGIKKNSIISLFRLTAMQQRVLKRGKALSQILDVYLNLKNEVIIPATWLITT